MCATMQKDIDGEGQKKSINRTKDICNHTWIRRRDAASQGWSNVVTLRFFTFTHYCSNEGMARRSCQARGTQAGDARTHLFVRTSHGSGDGRSVFRIDLR